MARSRRVILEQELKAAELEYKFSDAKIEWDELKVYFDTRCLYASQLQKRAETIANVERLEERCQKMDIRDPRFHEIGLLTKRLETAKKQLANPQFVRLIEEIQTNKQNLDKAELKFTVEAKKIIARAKTAAAPQKIQEPRPEKIEKKESAEIDEQKLQVLILLKKSVDSKEWDQMPRQRLFGKKVPNGISELRNLLEILPADDFFSLASQGPDVRCAVSRDFELVFTVLARKIKEHPDPSNPQECFYHASYQVFAEIKKQVSSAISSAAPAAASPALAAPPPGAAVEMKRILPKPGQSGSR